MACNPVSMFVFRMLYSGVGILVGLLIAGCFSAVFHNGHASLWGLISAAFAGISMAQFIYLFVVKERLRKAPHAIVLAIFGLVGALGIGAGFGAFVVYLGLAIIQSLNNPVSLVESYYIVCVWSFMTFKWAITTYIYSMISFKYLKKVPKGFSPMKNEEDPEDDGLETAVET